MDKETQHRLNQIQAGVSTKKITKEVDVMKDARKQLEKAYSQAKTEEGKQMIKDMLDSPQMHKKQETIDEEVAKKMSDAATYRIKKAIAQGVIEDPSLSVERFMRKIRGQ